MPTTRWPWRAGSSTHRRRTGWGHGRTPYAIRLGVDTDIAPAGTFVGTSSLGDFNPERQSAHLGWTLYDSRFWSTFVNPEAKLLLLTLSLIHISEPTRLGMISYAVFCLK